MQPDSYIPVEEPTNQLTVISVTLIIMLVCQIILPIMNHHAFEFYPNHPHLPNTQQHSHSYISVHVHQDFETFYEVTPGQSILGTELALIPDWSFTPGLVGMSLIWKWTQINFISESASLINNFKPVLPKHLINIFHPVQTNPPTSP